MTPTRRKPPLSRSIDGQAAAPTPIGWSAEMFADHCRAIVRDMSGHAAHRALDLLTNDVLRSLGFGEGIDIFEAAVRDWHRDEQPYPQEQSA